MLGGLAVGAILFDVVFTTFNFLRSSTTGFGGPRRLARGDAAEQRVVVLRSLLLSVIMGFCHADRGTAGAAARSDGNGCTPGGGSSPPGPTLRFGCWAAPAYLAQLLGSWMVCLGFAQARLALLLQTVLNGTNIGPVDFCWVWFGAGDLKGVAWATVIAEGVAAGLGLFLVWSRLRSGKPADIGADSGRVNLWPDCVVPCL